MRITAAMREWGNLSPGVLMTGFLVLTVPWWVLIPGVIVYGGGVYLVWRRVRQPEPGHCRECGYNLTGLPEARCPECGTNFDTRAQEQPRDDPVDS